LEGIDTAHKVRSAADNDKICMSGYDLAINGARLITAEKLIVMRLEMEENIDERLR
jgi:hypothetical protein